MARRPMSSASLVRCVVSCAGDETNEPCRFLIYFIYLFEYAPYLAGNDNCQTNFLTLQLCGNIYFFFLSAVGINCVTP